MIMPNFIQCFPVFHRWNQCKYKVKTITGEMKSDEKTYSSTNPFDKNLDALYYVLSASDKWTRSNIYYGHFLFLGSGKTEPTLNDYTLESPIDYSENGLHVISLNQNLKTDYKIFKSFNLTVRNNGTDPIEVSEIGWFAAWTSDGSTAQSSNWIRTMLARETFDTITLQPNEIRTFTMNIKIN